MDTDYTGKRSKKPLIIIAGVVGALIIVTIAVAMALGGSSRQEQQSATPAKNDDGSTVATKEQVQKNLDELNTSMQQATKDQQTAKASLSDSDKQIKVNE